MDSYFPCSFLILFLWFQPLRSLADHMASVMSMREATEAEFCRADRVTSMTPALTTSSDCSVAAFGCLPRRRYAATKPDIILGWYRRQWYPSLMGRGIAAIPAGRESYPSWKPCFSA